jgi:hypothetical protein
MLPFIDILVHMDCTGSYPVDYHRKYEVLKGFLRTDEAEDLHESGESDN